jgi:hypothetical protein
MGSEGGSMSVWWWSMAALAQDEAAFRPSLVGSSLLVVDEVGTSRDPALQARILGRAGQAAGPVGSDVLLSGAAGPLRFGLDLPLSMEGFGDVGLDGRVVALDRERAPIGVGLGGRLLLGSEAGEKPGYELSVAVDRDFGPLVLAINGGSDGKAALAAAGLAVDLSRRSQATFESQVRGGGVLGLSWLAGASTRLGPDWMLRGAVGSSSDGAGAPGPQVILGVGYRPPLRVHRGPDFDGDGMTNRCDRCSEVPEDRDGWADADGCPEVDPLDGEVVAGR